MERFKRNSVFDFYRGKSEQNGNNGLLRALFKSFDRNGSGFLEQDDVASILKEMGMVVPSSDNEQEVEAKLEEDVKEIFKKVDTNRDSRIDFDEFFNWWTFSRHENKMFARTIKIALRGRKLMTRASEYIQLFSLEPDDTEDKLNHRVSIHLGELIGAGGFILKGNFRVGLSEMRLFEEFSHGLSVDNDGLGIVIKFASEYPVKAQRELESIVNRILELCAALLPDWEDLIRFLEVSYTKDENSVKMAINIKHPLVKFFLDEYHQLILLFNKIDDIAAFNFEFVHQHSILELLNSQKSTFLLLFEGLRLTVSMDAKKKIATKLRERAFAAISAPVVKEGRPNVILKTFHPLLMLLSNSRCDLRFRTPENFLHFLRNFSSKGFVPPEAITLKNMLDDIRREGELAHLMERPIFQEIVDMFLDNFSCNVEVCVRLPLLSAIVSFQTKGIKEVIDYLRI